MRGYCGIGVVSSKNSMNVGTLWRSAAILEASFIFTVGRRYPHQASDTIKAWKHVPMYEYKDVAEFLSNLPKDCVPVAVEIHEKAKRLENFIHPERACYILGAEDTGIPGEVLKEVAHIVQLPGEFCLNVAVAGSIVLYDRLAKS